MIGSRIISTHAHACRLVDRRCVGAMRAWRSRQNFSNLRPLLASNSNIAWSYLSSDCAPQSRREQTVAGPRSDTKCTAVRPAGRARYFPVAHTAASQRRATADVAAARVATRRHSAREGPGTARYPGPSRPRREKMTASSERGWMDLVEVQGAEQRLEAVGEHLIRVRVPVEPRLALSKSGRRSLRDGASHATWRVSGAPAM